MKILELDLLSPDMKTTAWFYQTVLGFRLLTSHPGHLQLQAGDTILNFRPAEGRPCVYHLAFDIPHNQLEEAFEWVNQRVDILPVTNESKIADFVNWKAKSFYFFDPHGNILEYIARFKADTASKKHFNGDSVLYVSELGIVTADVQRTIRQVSTDFSVPVFSRQPPMQDFAALGDDRGLFIVVTEERAWYPTQTKSVRSFTRVVFEQHDQQFEWTIE